MQNTEQTIKKKKSPIKIIGTVLFSVVMIFLAVIISSSLIYKATGKQILPFTVLQVVSESMEPTIREDSYILVVKADTSSLKEGDIITFVSQDSAIKGAYNTHRIHQVVTEGEEFITKGDHNSMPDAISVHAEDIDYIYVCNLNLLTKFADFYSTLTGLIVTLCVITLLVGIYFYKTFYQDLKAKKKPLSQEEIDKLVAIEVQKLEEENKNK